MSSKTIAKKAVSQKLTDYSNKAFEELSGSKPSEKAAKIIKRSSRKLVKAIHGQIKKVNRKKSKQIKAREKKDAQPVKVKVAEALVN